VARVKNLIDGLTQDQAKERIYEIAERNGYRSRTDSWIECSGGRGWPAMDENDFVWIFDNLLPRHSYYEIKSGPGIAELIFGTSTRYPSKRLARPAAVMYAKRIDGTLTDISWRECLSPANKKFKIRNAMRNAIKPQIDEFRNACEKICQGCGTANPFGGFDVDHHPMRFEDLANQWLKFNNLAEDAIETCGKGDFEYGDNFVNADLEASWMRHHKTFAGLRILCVPCHRKATR
jgi:hypothetical protein